MRAVDELATEDDPAAEVYGRLTTLGQDEQPCRTYRTDDVHLSVLQ